MKTCVDARKVCLFVAVFAAFYPARARAQQYVYVNNNETANSVEEFTVATGGSTLITPTAFPTLGTGFEGVLAADQQGVGTYATTDCLFVSDPFSSTGFPAGDIAAFMLVAGTPTTAGKFAPTGDTIANKNLPLAVDRRAAYPYIYAAFTGEQKIVTFKVNPANCKLSYVSSTTAMGASGSPVAGIAISPAGPGPSPVGPHILVASYQDGSIESFTVSAGGVLASTAPPFFSTGHTTQNGDPAGVDITANGKFAIFGDDQNITEVEVSAINPSGALSPTVDYGGPSVGSGVSLGQGVNSSDLWISPGIFSGNNYVYVSNNTSRQVTSITLSPTTGVVAWVVLTSCTAGYSNITMLHLTGFTESGGIKTQLTTGTGNFIYVAEFGTPSSVAALKVDASGCTKEAPASPFTDPSSDAALSLSVFPFRPF